MDLIEGIYRKIDQKFTKLNGHGKINDIILQDLTSLDNVIGKQGNYVL